MLSHNSYVCGFDFFSAHLSLPKREYCPFQIIMISVNALQRNEAKSADINIFFKNFRILQEKLDQPVSAPPSPRDISMEIDSPENMMRHIRFLKNEVERLKKQLRAAQLQRKSRLLIWLPCLLRHVKLSLIQKGGFPGQVRSRMLFFRERTVRTAIYVFLGAL